MECTYCKNTFSTKTSLNNHQKTAKYCLKARGEDTKYKYKCDSCKMSFHKIYNLNRHIEMCKSNDKVYECMNNIKDLQEELHTQNVIINKQNETIEKYERTIKDLQDKLENIAIKAVQKSTTTVKNTQVNNYIQKMQPITQEYLTNHTPSLTIEHIKKGASGYAEYALEGPLKDRIACVDYSRRKIKFKDRDGNIITDPEMAKLAPMFFDSIKDKSSQLVYSLNTVDMDSAMFEGVAKLFNTNADVKNGATGIKTDFYHDFIKHVCSGSVIE